MPDLSDRDIRRIAYAVADELERRPDRDRARAVHRANEEFVDLLRADGLEIEKLRRTVDSRGYFHFHDPKTARTFFAREGKLGWGRIGPDPSKEPASLANILAAEEERVGQRVSSQEVTEELSKQFVPR